MSAHMHYELMCDAKDCGRCYNVAERTASATRRFAAERGWTHRYGANEGSFDYCPVHSGCAADATLAMSEPAILDDREAVRMAKHLAGAGDDQLALGLAPTTIRLLCRSVIRNSAVVAG